MPGWNPVQKSLEKGEADAAFTLAPIAMDLFSYGAPIKLILFAHKNGSICITGNLEHEKKAPAEFFKGKTFFIPHILSIHHMLLNMFLRNLGLKPGLMGMEGVNVFFEVVPPVKMPEFLVKSPEASGFMVAEPVGANTIARGAGKLLYLSGEIWSNHPCCVVAVRDDFINENENAVFEFCDLLIQAGRYIFENVDDSASIAVNFLDPNAELGLQKPVLKKVLTEPFGIKTDDLYPQIDDLDRIQRYMSEEMGIGTIIDLEKFVDTRFADVFSKELNIHKQPSIFRGSKDIIQTAIQRIFDARPVEEIHPKTPLKKEKTVYEISENENTLCFRISTDENLIKQVLEETKDFLSNFTVTDTGPLMDVYGELLKNAMVHGNQNDHGKQIFCSVESLDDARFKIMVKDEGDGFDYQQSSVFQNPTSSSNHSPGGYQRISPLVEKLEFNETGSMITAFIKPSFPDPYELSESGNWKIVTFHGDITEKHVELLEGFFREMVENGWEKIRFDFSGVSHMDAKSLTLFSTLAKMRESRGIKRDLEIVNINDDLLNLFKMTRLDGAFKLDDEM
jgi:anti-anti-sigma factor